MARGGGRGGRTYTRDSSGRFASSPGGGPPKRSTPASRRAAKPKRGALKPGGGTLTARSRLRAARAKLTPGASRQQKAAVTRAQNALRAAKKTARTRMQSPARPGVIRLGRRRKAAPQAPVATRPQGRQPNLRAQQAKAMANRTGVVSGRLRTDGQDTRTLSLAEMRRAVRQALRSGGIKTRAQFEKAYGKPPTTRSGWERLYKENVSTPQSERNRRGRPGVINGIDIQKNFRPWAVFGLNPKTATRADVQAAFRQLAKQNHPDVGGRRKDFERLQKMRDSMLAFMPDPNAKPKRSRSGGKRGKTQAPAATQGPRLLPAAREPSKPAKRTRKRRS